MNSVAESIFASATQLMEQFRCRLVTSNADCNELSTFILLLLKYAPCMELVNYGQVIYKRARVSGCCRAVT